MKRRALPWLLLLLAVLTGCGGDPTPGYGLSGEMDLLSAPDRRGAGEDDGIGADDDGVGSDGFQGLLDLTLDFGPGPETGGGPGLDLQEPPLCAPNGDGVLTAAELPTVIGAVAAFTEGPPGQTVAVPQPGGTWDGDCACHLWDFTATGPGDVQVWDGVLPASGKWFDGEIPGGDFVQTFGGGLLGVYSLQEDGLYMVGLASVAEDWTALRYDPPVRLLSLPMALGDSWSTQDAEAIGRFEGTAYPLDTGFTGVLSVEHTYSGKVDKRGRVEVPAGGFDAWRVVVDVTMVVRNSIAPLPVASVHRKVVLFMAECSGLVARLRSVEGEVNDDFAAATEYRRFGWPQGGTR